ncbi:tetratricopeptide repeat protein [Streptomyces sp. NP-1717]|uniref:tetratricopeptide repeat protein n=1 Tax=Streptomyces sp. NP-1717 TaxID=2704470 RepID=UPI001F5DC307|nr:tetratricopeptide repeat protein [Streptomyces sp. NP-1717]MCI3224142.1 tetratricopeptide repeat protein [Streptomyces sp. NP-1717]
MQAREVHGGIHLHPPPSARPTAVSPAPPRQLLPVPPHFTNRESDVVSLNRLRDTGLPLIVVTGPAGIGKTTLVSKWLRSLSTEFPDGQLYADLRGHSAGGPAGPTEVLGQFLRALGAGPSSTDTVELASQWRSFTADLRIAVMLDNSFTAAQIRPLLLGGPGGLVVVTSRSRLTGLRMEGAGFHQLDALEPAAGIELLSRGIGADRVAGELPAVRRLVALCAGLPLAVCLASARLATRPRQSVGALADALARNAGGGRLAALRIEGETSVHTALDESYAILSGETARLYRTLGLLPVRGFDVTIAAASCGESLDWAERRLDELIEANLVEDIGTDSWRFHDLVRIHAHDRAREDDTVASCEEALRRFCDWCLHTATAAQERLTPVQFTLPRTYLHAPTLPLPFEDDVAALGWLDSHRTQLLGAVQAAADNGWYDTSWMIVDAMWPLFLRLRYYAAWIEAHEIGLKAARQAGNKAAERQMLNSGAIGLGAARRTEEATAWYEASFRAAREAGDVRDEGQALLGLGACHREAGRPDDAVTYLKRAIAVWEGCGYPRGAALARTTLGEIALAAGAPDKAVDCFTRAHAAMVARMNEALAVFTESGAAFWQARTLEMLGESAAEHGNAGAATEFRTRALALFEATSPADARRLGEAPGAGP